MSVRHFVGEVEYSSISNALRERMVGKDSRVGTEIPKDYSGTAIYSYLNYYRAKFTSYVRMGTTQLFPKSEVMNLIDEFIEVQSKRSLTATAGSLNPETLELLRKLNEKPELASALLDLIS